MFPGRWYATASTTSEWVPVAAGTAAGCSSACVCSVAALPCCAAACWPCCVAAVAGVSAALRGGGGELRRPVLGRLRPRFEHRQFRRRQRALTLDRRDGGAPAGNGLLETHDARLGGTLRAREECSLLAEIDRELPECERPRCRLGAQAPVLGGRARQAVDAGHRLVERGRAENDGDRVGLALDVQRPQEGRHACLRGLQRAAHDVGAGAQASFVARELLGLAREPCRLSLGAREGGLGRVQLEEGSGLGAAECGNAVGERRRALRVPGRRCRDGEQRTRGEGRAEQRPP